jgi:hypothetical protein
VAVLAVLHRRDFKPVRVRFRLSLLRNQIRRLRCCRHSFSQRKAYFVLGCAGICRDSVGGRGGFYSRLESGLGIPTERRCLFAILRSRAVVSWKPSYARMNERGSLDLVVGVSGLGVAIALAMWMKP